MRSCRLSTTRSWRRCFEPRARSGRASVEGPVASRRGRDHRVREGGVDDRCGDARGQPAVDGQPLRVADLLPVQRRVSRDQRVAGARALERTTRWVLDGDATGFPLLYHWRLLPGEPPPPEPEHADPDEAVAYWHGAEGVARRLAAIRASTTALLLFLEHQPHRLDTWLRDRLDAGGAAAARRSRWSMRRCSPRWSG
jgi:hypothetical protein